MKARTAVQRYEQWSVLASGSYGTVYRAWDSRLERYVAIKQLHAHLALQEAFVERFQCEVRTLGRLNHDNIVRVHDIEDLVGPDGGRALPSIVMEHVDGPTLAQVLERRPADDRIDRKPLRFSVPIVQELLDALHAAHRLDPPIIHRDIKPGNLMIASDRLKVLDFGIARAATDRSASGLGAPAYQAPEQVRGGHLSPATDMYAVGGVLYELLTGRLAFDAMRGWGHEPPAPSEVHHRFEPFDEVIRRAMAPEPADRYQGAEQMSAGLDAAARSFRRAVAQQSAAKEQVAPVEVPTTTKASSSKASISRKEVLIGALVILVLMGALAVTGEESGPPTRLWLRNTADRIQMASAGESMAAPYGVSQRAWRVARDLGSTTEWSVDSDAPQPRSIYSQEWLPEPAVRSIESADVLTVKVPLIWFDEATKSMRGDTVPCDTDSRATKTMAPGVYLVFAGSAAEREAVNTTNERSLGRWVDSGTTGRNGTSYYLAQCSRGGWPTTELNSLGSRFDSGRKARFVIPPTREGTRALEGLVLVTAKRRLILVPFEQAWQVESDCDRGSACIRRRA